MRFTARYAASKGAQALVLEDAPRPTRVGYIKNILCDFVGNAQGKYGTRPEPLDITEAHQSFIGLIRDESDSWDYDPNSNWGALTTHLKDCTWTEFYDFVELLGKLLIKKVDDGPFDSIDYYKIYQTKVNALLQEDGIGWSLSEESELRRQVPKALATRSKATEERLKDKFEAARGHFRKAQTYLYQHPIDEANSIKEIVSAIESVSRVLVPKASTLGDAIKQLRKDPTYSPYLLDSLEKLYIYSNATPMIRHGHVSVDSPALAEAELCLHLGIAFIKYLMDTKGA